MRHDVHAKRARLLAVPSASVPGCLLQEESVPEEQFRQIMNQQLSLRYVVLALDVLSDEAFQACALTNSVTLLSLSLL